MSIFWWRWNDIVGWSEGKIGTNIFIKKWSRLIHRKFSYEINDSHIDGVRLPRWSRSGLATLPGLPPPLPTLQPYLPTLFTSTNY